MSTVTFKKYGPITKDGFTFETSEYTSTVNVLDYGAKL